MIVKYMIAEDEGSIPMAEKINDLISQGWEPLGSVSVIETTTRDGSCFTYFQSMVKRESSKRELTGHDIL